MTEPERSAFHDGHADRLGERRNLYPLIPDHALASAYRAGWHWVTTSRALHEAIYTDAATGGQHDGAPLEVGYGDDGGLAVFGTNNPHEALLHLHNTRELDDQLTWLAFEDYETGWAPMEGDDGTPVVRPAVMWDC